MVQATDANSQDTRGSWAILSGTGVGRFGIDVATGRVFVTNNSGFSAGASYTLQVRTTDNGSPTLSGTGTITINVVDANVINLPGVAQEFWNDIGGNNVSALTSDPRYPSSPSGTRPLPSFDTGSDYADNYGSRIRGYVVPPTSGSYVFYVTGDDETQLRLSTDANPANAAQIANVGSATPRNNWTTFPSQSSPARTLVAGQRYFIETLHKEGVGGDYVQVAWTGPGISTPTILTENVLDAFHANLPPTWAGAPFAFSVEEGAAAGTLVGTLSASDGSGGAIAYTITGGNGAGAFAINGSTGAITVANAAALTPGQTIMLQVAAQDSGGGIYPLKTANTTAAITVTPDLRLVSPASSIVNIPANVGLLLEATHDSHVGSTIAWSKTSGPGTVTFDAPDALATGATFSTVGGYVLRCTETNGAVTTAFDVTVNVGGTPVYTLSRSRVGAQALSPNHTVANGVYQIDAAGAGIPSSSTPDDFAFVQIPVTENVTVTARVVSVQAVNGSNSRAGVIIRESLAADSRSAFCGVTSQNGGRFIFRANTGANSENASATVTLPYWVRLIRSGNAFSAQVAPDSNGNPGGFVSVGTAQTIAISTNAFVGLAASSGSPTAAGRAVIDKLTITPTPANVGPLVQAGADATVPASGTATLNGTASDDNKPTPPTLSVAWSKVSGPGAVVFGNASVAQTTATFAEPGAYVLRLTADDSHTRTFDEVTLTQALTFDQWRQQHFGASADDDATAGSLADPDADGRNNLIEYAIQSDPRSPDTSGITTDAEVIGADRFLRLTVGKNPLATGITLSIEVTADLSARQSWSALGTTVEINHANTLRTRDNTQSTLPHSAIFA